MDKGEGIPKASHIGQPGPFGSRGIGWQGSQIDFEVKNTSKPYEATAWDEDVCVAAFQTRSRIVLLVRLWVWHFRFNRGPNHTDGSGDACDMSRLRTDLYQRLRL